MMGHKCETNDFAGAPGTHPAHGILIKLNHASERRQRAVIVALDGRTTRLVAEDHGIGHGAVNETKRDGRVTGVVEGALAFDEHPGYSPVTLGLIHGSMPDAM